MWVWNLELARERERERKHSVRLLRMERRKKHHEELHGLYCSPVVIWVIKWRRMRLAGYNARMGLRRTAYVFCVGETLRKNTWKNRV
jgi:hypothetical protein